MLNQTYGFDIRPRQFFIDMNSFFTSCEQQECAEHRNKPTIVVPMFADTTVALAASYEAKAYGIRTGTNVKEARELCPHLHIVEARPRVYLQYNARINEILNDHFATVRSLSIDEMACRVPHIYDTEDAERRAALRVKEQMRRELGPFMRCSIGVGPNVFLAKVASECMKPDGLTIWNETNLPHALFDLPLQALPGIGKGVKKRLSQHSIFTMQDLWRASPSDLRRAWGGVVGEQWWYMLRGSSQIDYAPSHQASDVRKSVSHSNILAPHHRTREIALRILLELSEKALKRIRTYEQAALSVTMSVRYRRVRGVPGDITPFEGQDYRWHRAYRLHTHASDDLTWRRVIRPMLEESPDFGPYALPVSVAIAYGELVQTKDVNLSLFDETVARQRLATEIDGLNRKYRGVVALGSLSKERQVPLRIPFGSPEQPAVHPY